MRIRFNMYANTGAGWFNKVIAINNLRQAIPDMVLKEAKDAVEAMDGSTKILEVSDSIFGRIIAINDTSEQFTITNIEILAESHADFIFD